MLVFQYQQIKRLFVTALYSLYELLVRAVVAHWASSSRV
jgi:hypothetical protein